MKLAFGIVVLGVLASCNGDDQRVNPGAIDASPTQDTSDPIDSVPSDPDAPDASGLILLYSFEDSATQVTDSSTRAKHGLLSDVAAWTADGRIGRGLSLAGGPSPVSQYVELPNGVLTGVGDFSIAVWVKLNSIADWARIYDFGNGLGGPANRFMYFTPNGFLGGAGILASSFGGDPTNENILNSNTRLPVGVWKHLVITGSSGNHTIFIDGFPAAHITGGPAVTPGEMEPLSPQSWLGRSRFPDPGLDGTLDDFRIYDRILTATEIADLAAPKLDYAHWRFDETSGATAADSSDHATPTVLSNGAGFAGGGRLGGAINFPGGPSGATGPTATLASNPLAGCTTQLTVAVWTKLRTATAWSRIFDFGTAMQKFIFLAPTDGIGLHFAMVSPNGVFDLVAPAGLAADSAWHHVAATVAANGLATLYVDGNVVASATSPTVRPSDFSDVTELFLGKSRFPDPYLDGSLDDLRIGCRALTADEIKNLAHAGP